MIMESVRAFYRGYYDRFVTPNLDVREGYIHFPQTPGIGTKLRPEVLERKDAIVQTSTL
jgi:L-alanine-DL-glutamate epimerase-like enolase superfamily enzyme